MSSSLCTLLDDITKEVLPYIDIRFTSYYSQILWDALMSFLSNPTRTDSLVILYLKRKKTKGRAFWRLWHLFMEFNQYTSVLLLMITFEVYFFSLSWLLHSHKVFLAIAFRVRTLLTSATFRPYSGAEKEAPIETQVFLNFIADSRLERAEQWNSWAPDPSNILCRFLSVIPPPGIMIILPLAWSTSRLMRGSPSKAELSQPLVNTRSNPNDISASRATAGSWTMSKARWKVTGKGRAAASVQKSKKTKERNGKVQNVKQKCKTVKYDLYIFLPLWKPSLIASCTAILYIKDCWLHFFVLHIASNNTRMVTKTWDNIQCLIFGG